MSSRIVESSAMVLLVGGGAVDSNDLTVCLDQADRVVAADGGARHLLQADRVPDAVIGDFDSLGADLKAKIPADRLHPVPEQDSTDFEKCLSRIAAPLVLGLGFMGPRTDHQLAAYHGLIRCADQPCLLVGGGQCAFLCPPEITLDMSEGDLVSAFPLVALSARSTGLHWPLDGLPLQPGHVIGTSNRASGASVTIRCDRPGLLIILPDQARRRACQALISAVSRWPARAG